MLNKIDINYGNKFLPAEEAAIIERVRCGEAEAFKILYHKNVGKIYALCFRISGNRYKADLLTQDAFVKAWENIEKFRGESSFSTWIYRIAVNNALEAFRLKKRRILKFISISENIFYEKKDSGNKIDLEKAISLLPEKARLVFILHDVEGYRHDEIAAMMAISSGTSKAQLHRARKILRKNLLK
jgi:RNA polymerase sigma-70 factor, ECF subfamily